MNISIHAITAKKLRNIFLTLISLVKTGDHSMTSMIITYVVSVSYMRLNHSYARYVNNHFCRMDLTKDIYPVIYPLLKKLIDIIKLSIKNQE
jgi:hypothetical protein